MLRESTYFVLIGRSHDELGRFTGPSLPLSSDEMRSVEMRSDEMRRHDTSDMNVPQKYRIVS